VTISAKTDRFYRPVSKPDSKPKRPRILAVKLGFEMAVTDPALSVRFRLEALDSLARLNPTRRFLIGLIRKTDTPGRLRLAATQLLDKIRTADKAKRNPGLSQAERTAKELLERIRGQQAQPASDTTLSEGKEAGAEAVSVFDGVD
jgi:hypothetical protein